MLYLIIFLLLVNIAVSFKTLKSSTNMNQQELDLLSKLQADETAEGKAIVSLIENNKAIATKLNSMASGTPDPDQSATLQALVTDMETNTSNILAELGADPAPEATSEATAE